MTLATPILLRFVCATAIAVLCAAGAGCAQLHNAMSERQIEDVLRREFSPGMEYSAAWDRLEALGVSDVHHGITTDVHKTISAKLPGSGSVGVADWGTILELDFTLQGQMTSWQVSKYSRLNLP